MEKSVLNLEELNLRQKKNYNKETFDIILKECHNHIRKLNKKNVKACYYMPPLIIFGRPTYDYNTLLLYLMKSLDNNGLYVCWSDEKDSIYISWRPEDLNITSYKSNTVTDLINKDGKYCVINHEYGTDFIPTSL